MKAFIEKIKAALVEDARNWWKWWSVRVDLIGVAFAGYFMVFPGVAMDVWNQLPPDLKALIPAQWTQAISVGLLVLSLVVRTLKQKNLESNTK